MAITNFEVFFFLHHAVSFAQGDYFWTKTSVKKKKKQRITNPSLHWLIINYADCLISILFILKSRLFFLSGRSWYWKCSFLSFFFVWGGGGTTISYLIKKQRLIWTRELQAGTLWTYWSLVCISSVAAFNVRQSVSVGLRRICAGSPIYLNCRKIQIEYISEIFNHSICKYGIVGRSAVKS